MRKTIKEKGGRGMRQQQQRLKREFKVRKQYKEAGRSIKQKQKAGPKAL